MVQIQSNTAVVVAWMTCAALVTHTLKHPLNSRKLQSQVPECLAKPCPPLPRWYVLTLVKLVFKSYVRLVMSLYVSWLLCIVAIAPARCSLCLFVCLFFAPYSSRAKNKKYLCVVNHSQLPPKQLACLILNITLFLLLISDWISVVFSCGHLELFFF